MNEEEVDMYNSLIPNTHDFKVGEFAKYREGLGKADVKIISKIVENNWIQYDVEIIGNANWGMKKGDVIRLGKKSEFAGYVGWVLQPLVEMN